DRGAPAVRVGADLFIQIPLDRRRRAHRTPLALAEVGPAVVPQADDVDLEKAPASIGRMSSTLTSCSLPSLMWRNVGIEPRRSRSVCSLTAALVDRNGAQSNRLRHRSIVVESSA